MLQVMGLHLKWVLIQYDKVGQVTRRQASEAAFSSRCVGRASRKASYRILQS
jgi:hypothetical protein